MAYVLWNHINPGGLLLKNICIEGEEVKYVKSGNDILFYDIQKELIYDTPRVFLMYPNIETSPSGGTISPSVIDYRQLWRRIGYSDISYEQEEIINKDATITFKIIEGTGATVDSSGTVTWESRGIEYGVTSRSVIVEMTVTLNGKSEKTTAVVSQKPNIITDMQLLDINPGVITGLPEYEAWECPVLIESIEPASSKCLLTFSSGDTLLDTDKYVDYSIEYFWESSEYYVILQPAQTGESCIATLDSRGVIYDPNYRKATITRRATITASLKVPYREAYPIWEDTYAFTDIIQKPNLLFIKEFTVTPGIILGPEDMYLSKGDTKVIESIEDAGYTGILEFSSKEITYDIDYYGSVSIPEYSWSSDQSYAIVDDVNSPFTLATMESRGIIIGPDRQATITRWVYLQYTLYDFYGGGSKDSVGWCDTVITQERNYINKVEALIKDIELGDHFYYPSIDEYGGIVAPQFNGTAQYWFSSEEGPFIYDDNAPGSWNFSRTYQVLVPNSYASLDSNNGYITWSPNTVNDKQYVTIESQYTVECYSEGETVSHFIIGTAVAMMEEIKIVITYYPPQLRVEPPTEIPASGGEIKYSDIKIHYTQVKETINYAISPDPTYEYITEGGDLNYWLYDAENNIVDKVVGENLLKNITPRTRKGHIYATVTMNGLTGELTEIIYQQANNLYLNVDIDDFYYYNAHYSGGTKYPQLTHSCQVYFTSGSKEDWSYGGKTYSYGVLSYSVYYSSGNANGASFNNSNGVVTWEGHNSEYSRDIQVTAYVDYTFSHNNGFQVTGSESQTAYCVQLGRPEKELESERLVVVLTTDKYIFSAEGNETAQFSYIVYHRKQWLWKDDTRTFEEVDVTNSVWHHYSVTNSDYFKINWSTGELTTLQENDSGDEQNGTVSLDIEYFSSESGKTLEITVTQPVKQRSSHCYLTIRSSKHDSITLSTSASLKGSNTTKIIALTGKEYQEEITNGITSVLEGTVNSSGTTIYIYEVEGNEVTKKLGSFVYESGRSITVDI